VIARNQFFQKSQVTTNSILLREISSPQIDAGTGGSFVQFKFECRFPERAR